jgi:hypothetical protein
MNPQVQRIDYTKTLYLRGTYTRGNYTKESFLQNYTY